MKQETFQSLRNKTVLSTITQHSVFIMLLKFLQGKHQNLSECLTNDTDEKHRLNG